MSLPRVVAGKRRPLMVRLLANGFAQALAAFAIAWLARDALAALDGAGGTVAGARGLRIAGLVRVDAERLGQEYVTKVRLRLFERIAALPARHQRVGRFGLTMTRMVTDLNSVRRWVSVGVARSAVAAVALVGLLAALAYFDHVVALVAGSLLALCALAGLALTPALRAQVREARQRRGRLAGEVGEKIFAFGTIRHHGGTRRELRRLRRQSRRMTRALVRRMRLSGVLRSLPDAVFPLAIAGLVFLAGTEGAALSRGDLVVTLLLLGMLSAPVRDLALAWDQRLGFLEGRRRIGEILASPRMRESARPVDLAGTEPIAVSFHDARVAGVFEAATASAASGERILVVGPSGSGKSTLLALAARLFDPDAGEVCFDGVSLRELRLGAIEEAVRLVSPDLPLLRGSVAQNVAYGAGAGGAGRVQKIAELCGIEAGSDALPRGLDTRVEEKGRNLSAGLRARVSLARALAAEPRLLLIDDPLLTTDPDALASLRRALDHTDATCLLVGRAEIASVGIDRIWRIEAGCLREETLSHRTADLAVAPLVALSSPGARS
jgi:ABC-type multidrug transport system fused ATPase/permease subunit